MLPIRISPGRGDRTLRTALAAFACLYVVPVAAEPNTPIAPQVEAQQPHGPNAFDVLYERLRCADAVGEQPITAGPQPPPGSQPAGTATRRPIAHPRSPEQEEAAQAAAIRYYQTAAEATGLTEPPARLEVLLEHLGYAGMTSHDLERLEPDVLMDTRRLLEQVTGREEFTRATQAAPLQPDEILAARFFSPKTTDVSGHVHSVGYSWRKLVRLRARPGSPGSHAGADSLYFLTNVYEPDLERNPFESESHHTQIILTRRADAAWPASMYWFLFAPQSAGGSLQDHSYTSWDAVEPQVGVVDNRYYVPHSCAACHGNHTRHARLQYLDSDHWQDRVQAGDDFPEVGRSRWTALFDAGRDPAAKSHHDVMQVLRKLNAEILAQNEQVDLALHNDESDFQTRAARTWLELHAANDAHLPPAQRAIVGADGQTRWDPARDADLLTQFNRYCFRCHSSVAFHVFDKQAVLERLGDMIDRLKAPNYYIPTGSNYDAADRMPQDREFDPPGLRQDLIEHLEALQTRPMPMRQTLGEPRN